ncbi:MAG: T9SS type A sorting domain-containing protein [Ignavibacteriales bacterium]|nr:T9SS type A sorting domain-containing protein [Ignavibacteriales bacterium]
MFKNIRNIVLILLLSFTCILSQEITSSGVSSLDYSISNQKMIGSVLSSLSYNTISYAHTVVGTKGPISFALNNFPLYHQITTYVDDYLYSGDFAADGKWYSLDYYGNTLVSVDTVTGLCDTINPCYPKSGEYWCGLSYDFSTGNMYAVSTDITKSTLYTINLVTGDTNVIGTQSTHPALINLACSNTGLLYSIDIVYDKFVSIDKTTGLTTEIGDIGFNANYAQDMEFDPENDLCYGLVYGYSDKFSGPALTIMDIYSGEYYLIDPLYSGFFTGFGIPGSRMFSTSPSPAFCPVPNDDISNIDPSTGLNLSWINPAGVLYNELYFSKDPRLVAMCDPSVRVLNGFPVTAYTNYSIPYTLDMGRNYYWRVVEYDNLNGRANSTMWNFSTEPMAIFFDDFESGIDKWLVDGGTPPSDSCGWILWDSTTFITDYMGGLQLPPEAGGMVAGVNSGYCNLELTSILEIKDSLNLSDYQDTRLEFDMDFQNYGTDDTGFVQVSIDGGYTWDNLDTICADRPAEHILVQLEGVDGQPDVRLRFWYSNISLGWYWVIDNVTIYGVNKNPTKIEDEIVTPEKFSLEQNYPNPFNPSTTIRFSLPSDSKVKLEIYNLLGEKITELVNTDLKAGQHEFQFNSNNLSSGVYFYRIKVINYEGNEFNSTKKMLLLK